MSTIFWRSDLDNQTTEMSESHPIPVREHSQPTTILAGTKSLTTTAVSALAVNQPCESVIVQNDHDNTIDVLIGDATNQTYQLTPGDSIVIETGNVNDIYAKNVSSATQSVNWIAAIRA